MGTSNIPLEQAYQQLTKYQQLAQYPPLTQSVPQGLSAGLLGSALGTIANANGWYGNSTTTIPEAYQSQPSYDFHFPSVTDRIIRFFRINKAVEMYEGQKVEEPLDELRVKVATWLNN